MRFPAVASIAALLAITTPVASDQPKTTKWVQVPATKLPFAMPSGGTPGRAWDVSKSQSKFPGLWLVEEVINSPTRLFSLIAVRGRKANTDSFVNVWSPMSDDWPQIATVEYLPAAGKGDQAFIRLTDKKGQKWLIHRSRIGKVLGPGTIRQIK